MSKAYPRSRRVAEQIQRTLSEMLRRDVRDPRLGPVTLTEVRVADDLSHAKVFYTVLGSGLGKGPDPELTQEILDDAANLLRGRLGRSLRLRHAPQLQFVADTLIDEGSRLSSLISRAVKQDIATHVDSELDSEDGDADATPSSDQPNKPVDPPSS